MEVSPIAGTRGETWFSRDLPVLRAAVYACEENTYGRTSTARVVELSGLPRDDVLKALVNLRTRHVRLLEQHSLRSADYIVEGITAEGLEASGAWPSPTVLQERFIAAMEAAIDEAPAGSPKAIRLSRVLQSITDLATGTGGNVFGQILWSSIGGS